MSEKQNKKLTKQIEKKITIKIIHWKKCEIVHLTK